MELLSLALIALVVLAGISVIAALRRIAAATERSADALEAMATANLPREVQPANDTV
jgi:hypothetical protein